MYDNIKDIALPIVAIVISLISLLKTISIQKKIYSKTLLSEIFEKNFLDILINKLPSIIEDIKLDCHGRIEDEFIISIEEIVSEISQKSRFYKFYDKKFYRNLMSNLIQLEDFVFLTANLINLNEGEKIEDIKNQLNSRVEVFYEFMMKYYCKL